MQDLKVTLVQANQIWEDKQSNYDNYEQLFALINFPTDLILLPELFDTGFSMNISLAEEMENSTGIHFLKKRAKTLNVAFYTSLMIREGIHVFNRGIFVLPNGDLHTYDKRKSFCLGGEHKYYTAGKIEKIVEYKSWKFNLQICYDLRFPEIARNFEVNNVPKYDVLLYVANWPSKRVEHWKTLLKARAIENQSYVIGVNRVGEDPNGLVYTGDSLCADALGQVTGNSEGQSIFTTTLSQSTLNNTRLSLPFLRDY